MAQRKGLRRAAALLALAALLCAGLRAASAQRIPLIIEVIAATGQPVEDAQPAAAVQDGPRVLIYHTHTWEAYEMTKEMRYTPTETWRTKDERFNMIRVGEELSKALQQHGFIVVHDQTAFEPPNLSTSYTRSLAMLESRMNKGERYDYIFDIHRDAYSGPYNGANAVEHQGRSAAYVMLLVGKGTGVTGSGFDERPDWPQNLELARQITGAMNAIAPGIARDVKIKTGRFNQHVSTGALLIEVGNNMNTLDEALSACAVIAQAIADAHAAHASD